MSFVFLSMVKEKIIQQGAEAILIKVNGSLIKRRVKKGYRFPALDEKLRKSRTKKETKLLEKTAKLISVPKVLSSSPKDKEIIMEFIDGKKLSEYLDEIKNWQEVCEQIGGSIAKLHDADIIHGDITTSNLIYSNDKVYFIDFGLSFISSRIEDKAVDLHLIKQALEAKHYKKWKEYFEAILKGYKESKNFEKVMKQLEKVELRGRYKQAY